ncbi:MAG: DUF362 domain-containing protein [Promethearchaeota archaeon]
MKKKKAIIFDSPLGKKEADSSGSPVGVVRIDANKSYTGIRELLQKFINNSDQESWNQITKKIDYTYNNIDYALSFLEEEASFNLQINERLEKGQKLLFKPNIVSPMNIDSQTHGVGRGSNACTEWAFIASLMRWFHDKIGISYHQMMIGDAATAQAASAKMYTRINPENKIITPEAVIEGKSGDFYGGWGFYFVRKYLAESLKDGESDDPLKGYEESISGTYIPPGNVTDKLMVYDLNRIYDDPNKGRVCNVPDGVNYKSICIHKVIVGGNPDDTEDLKAYPGCILVNVPKLKVHCYTLFTNVIKNLGIGLYPMQYSSKGNYKWDYAAPHDTTVVGMKSMIPHEIWVPEFDHSTYIPKRDSDGNYIVKKTGGLNATMIDIIKATIDQDILMIHVVDGIEAINLNHTGPGKQVIERMIFAGLDPVATDTLCARYMFSNVPFKEALEVKLNGGTAGGFPQKVPIPAWDGKNIITNTGYDCPLAREILFEKAEKNNLGQMKYFVKGFDVVSDSPIITLNGHLGTIQNGIFTDLITETIFYDGSILWNLQKTVFSYLSVVDELDATKRKEEILEFYDEDKNGIISYEETGKKGTTTISLYAAGDYTASMGKKEEDSLKVYNKMLATMYKSSNIKYNADKHDFMKEYFLVSVCNAAYTISQLDNEIPDPFMPGLTCGKGKWPSFQLAQFFQKGMIIFGPEFPFSIITPSLYGNSLFYADLTQNGGHYVGNLNNPQDPSVIGKYISDVASNKIKPLNFVLYVPEGFNNLAGNVIPNVEVTDDPAKIFTTSFLNGKEVWP